MVDCCLCIDLTLLDLKPKRLVGFWGMQMSGIPNSDRRPNVPVSGGAVGFVIEFGGVCYQDTYPDVSCVYPAGYTYPDVS